MQDKYDFEKQLRQELKNYKVPDGYKERMKQLCDKLPEKKIDKNDDIILSPYLDVISLLSTFL